MKAAAIGEAELVRPLLQSGVKLHLRDHAGATPRDWDSMEDHVEIVELLSPQGAFGTVSPDGSIGTNHPQQKGCRRNGCT